MKKIFVLLMVCLIVSGCATPTKPNSVTSGFYGGFDYKQYKVQIISEPPGAKIEIDNDYVGTTPLTQVLDGHVGMFTTSVIKAYPIEQGQYVQTKIIYGNQHMPRKIYFNMNLKPVGNEINVNVNQR